MNDVASKIADMKKKVFEISGRKAYLELKSKEANTLLKKWKKEELSYEKALEIAKTVAETTQERLRIHLSGMVSSALQAVFKAPYEFHVDFTKRRNTVEVDFSLSKGKELDKIDILNASGGGVADVASFSLRVACLLLSTPKRRPFLAMDEPFRFVSEEYQARIGELIRELNKTLGIEFLIISHEKELSLDEFKTTPDGQ